MSVIELKNVCKAYGGYRVLDRFSLKVEEGDYVSITGPSGKGKTTILNIIGMLTEPDSGTLRICGYEDLRSSCRAAVHIRRDILSYLFQNYGLIDQETVEENMEISLRFKKLRRGEKKKLMSDALKKVRLAGYEKRKIYTLSGGEQQRVALAKIIARSPKIILADEPTGSLDEKNRDYVLRVLEKFNREGRTVIVVTHDPCVAACAKRHICL